MTMKERLADWWQQASRPEVWRVYAGPAAAADRKPYRMEKKDKSADIFLYDIIGDSWEGTTAKQFAIDLKALGDLATLNLFINSPGGSVFEGVAIFNQLKRHRARKIVRVDGMAGSIASVIAMVGDEILMAKNSFMMIHDAWGIAMGNAEVFRDVANRLEKITDTIRTTYVDRTGQKEDKIRNMMTAETWIGAEEAVEMGFADSLAENEAEFAALSQDELSKFKNIPKSLAEQLAKPKETAPEPATAPAPHPGFMKATAALARLKLNPPGPALNK